MIVYESVKKDFLNDFLNQTLIDSLLQNYTKKLGRVRESEKRSWENSLMFMYQVLEDQEIPYDMGIALEYKIPYTNNRIDVILTGYNKKRSNCAVIIELKQWSTVEQSKDKVGYVVTMFGGSKVTTEHPSYQAWSYAYMLENYNEAVIEGKYEINPCAFLHNYSIRDKDVLLAERYSEYIEKAPVFAKGDIRRLREFIKTNIHYGDNKEGLYTIENGKIAPSKSLQNSLSSMLNGNTEFVLLDRQFSVFEKGLWMAQQSNADNKKRVLIVKGGPGTGKSVVAINLLVTLMTQNRKNKIPLNATYVTKNESPRKVYEHKLQYDYTNAYIKNLFKGSLGTFIKTEENAYDVILCDEAHRLMKNSGRFFPGSESQIKEIIKSARTCIFFIDEYQRICLDDYGTVDRIKEEAENANALIEEMKLESQFRCNGSDGYLKWIEDVLEINTNANVNDMGMDYEFKVFDNPNDMANQIELNNKKNNQSRIVAGYCWEWISSGKNNPDIMDIEIDSYNFKRSWNLTNGIWAIGKGSVNQVGCIHTCQGLEFDYVGVIIGDDLRYENGQVVCDYTKRAKSDKSLNGIIKMSKENQEKANQVATEIIKNTYRVLMSRGMKGCYVYCTNKALASYLKKRASMCKDNVDYYLNDTGDMLEVMNKKGKV